MNYGLTRNHQSSIFMFLEVNAMMKEFFFFFWGGGGGGIPYTILLLESTTKELRL
jgi:hypothetical protein